MIVLGDDGIAIVQSNRQGAELDADTNGCVQIAQIGVKGIPPDIADITEDLEEHEVLNGFDEFHCANQHGGTADGILIAVNRADVVALETTNGAKATGEITVEDPNGISTEVFYAVCISRESQDDVLVNWQEELRTSMELDVVGIAA